MSGAVVTDPRDTHVRTTRRPVSATQRREARAARSSRRDRALAPAQRRPVPSRQGIRLTRRGRMVMLVGIATMLALAGVALGRGVAAAGSLSGEERAEVIVVGPGETLWQVAGQIAPDVDRRITVDRLQEANALRGSLVVPGQSLIVPADL